MSAEDPATSPVPQAERETERSFASSLQDSQATNGGCLKDYAKIVYLNIPTAHLEGSHVVYDIEVGIPGCMWRLSKRYSEFFNLHQQLQWFYSFHSDELPKKKILGNKTSTLIEKRRSKLESYLKHVLRTFPIPPPQFLNFINYQYYDVVGVTQALASRLFHVGEKILVSNDPAILSVVQMYCITRRLKLPLEKRSNDTSLDVANLYEFVNRLKHLKLVSDTPDCLSSSLLSELKFDLSIFRNLHSLQMEGCSMQQVEGWSHLLDTLELLVIRKSARTMSDALLQPGQGRGENDRSSPPFYPSSCQWRALTHIYLSNNFLREVDESITLVPYLQFLDLSHNSIEEVPESALTYLHGLSFLDLSHNKLENVDSLHTKLGNIHTLDVSHNRIRSLVGLRKLYCVVILNLKFNSIDDLSYLGHLGKLPCLESLQLDNNPVCFQPRYRAEVFGALPLTYETVMLDGHRATSKELAEAEQLISKRPLASIPRDATPSEGKRPTTARRVVTVSEDREDGTGGAEGDGAPGDSESLREATEQLREEQGRDWLSRYNEQLEREAAHGSPTEPTAIGQHPPPSKAQGYMSGGEGGLLGNRTESDIRQLASKRSEGDLTPAARVSHVMDLETNSESEDQAGQVFMVEETTFSGALSDLRALDAAAFQALTSPDTEHETLVVKVDLDGGQILFLSLDNSRCSESPKHLERWKSITVLQSCLTTVCIEEHYQGAVSCRLLCLSSAQEASQLCQVLHELVGRATDTLPLEESPSSDTMPPLGPFSPGDRQLTKISHSIFATNVRGLYSQEGFFSSRVAPELLTTVYYLRDLMPGGVQEVSRFNAPDDSCQEEELLLAVRAGFLPSLSSRVEFHSLVLVTDKALHLLELDPAPSPPPQGETTHLLTLRLTEISKITVGLFDQSLRFECSRVGPLGSFTLFTREYSVTQSLLDTLKQVLLAAPLTSEGEFDSVPQESVNSLPVQIAYQGTSHLNELKKRLFLHSVKDTYNSMNPEDMASICEDGVKNIEIIFYLIINELESVGGQEVLVPVSLLLTKGMLYLCAEDYNEEVGGGVVTPIFQVLYSNPVSTLDNIELFRNGDKGDKRIESELRLYFESGGSSMWRLYITDVGVRGQFVSSLKKLWEDEFSHALKTSTICDTDSSSYHFHSIRHKPREVAHIVMPQELVNFAWQSSRSPSAFQGVMKRMSPSIKQRQEQIAYVMLTWCSPYTRPHSLVPTCVVLTDFCLYLCTSQRFFSLVSEKTASDESSVCLYDSVNLTQIHQVVLGLFDYHFRLDTNYSANTYAFLTFDNRQTSEFMSHLGDKFKKVLNPTLGQEEIPDKEVSELEAKFSLTEVLLSSPSDTDIQTLTDALQFEARKVVPQSQLEGPSSIISYVLVLYDIGEANMQPHAVLITGEALFLCRIDLVRWPIAQFVVSPPTSLQYEVVDVMAFEWIEHVELTDFKSSTFKIVFTPQRNTEPSEDTHSNSGSEECIDLPQPLVGYSRWSLMTKDYKQRDLFLKALDGVYQGRGNNRPVCIQLATINTH